MEEAELIQIRRHLHQIPELALEEHETHAYLMKLLQKLAATTPFMELAEPAALPTAILVRLEGAAPQKTIGYRTDIDALPVTEQTGLPYASTHPGMMHACGHDLHMSVALGILAHFCAHRPQDHLLIFFQPAEESQSGGMLAFQRGIFSGRWRPDEFYGLHVNPDLPAGTIGGRMGTLFAGTTEVNIDLVGKGGHAAFPQDARDAVVAAAALITQAQTIVSRSIDPVQAGVLTFGKVSAGTIRNVIAERARIEGTIRGLSQEMIETIDYRLAAVCEGIATSFGVQVDLDLNQGGYWPVENDPARTRRLIDWMQAAPGVTFQETPPAMTGEDFGYLLAQFPGTMVWLGVGGDSPLHSATLVPDEAAIGAGVRAWTGFLTARMTD